MTLPTSGPISLGMIHGEFGGPTPIVLSNYYRGGAYVPNQDPNLGIPTSGQISFSQFYGASSGPLPTPPVVGADPSINGDPMASISSSYTAGYANGNPAPTNTRSWRVNGSEVSTAATYTPTGADVGGALTISEIWSNSQGSATGTSPSKSVAAYATGPVVQTAPVINGTPTIGTVCTYTQSQATGTPAPTITSIEWKNAGGTVVGTGATYTPTTGDYQGTLTVTDTWTNSVGSAHATSAAVAVAGEPIVLPPSINNAPQVGVLSTYTGATVWQGAIWQSTAWLVNGAIVSYATSYTPVAGDASKQLVVRENYTYNGQGYVTDSASAYIQAGVPVLLSSHVLVSGNYVNVSVNVNGYIEGLIGSFTPNTTQGVFVREVASSVRVSNVGIKVDFEVGQFQLGDWFQITALGVYYFADAVYRYEQASQVTTWEWVPEPIIEYPATYDAQFWRYGALDLAASHYTGL